MSATNIWKERDIHIMPVQHLYYLIWCELAYNQIELCNSLAIKVLDFCWNFRVLII